MNWKPSLLPFNIGMSDRCAATIITQANIITPLYFLGVKSTVSTGIGYEAPSMKTGTSATLLHTLFRILIGKILYRSR